MRTFATIIRDLTSDPVPVPRQALEIHSMRLDGIRLGVAHSSMTHMIQRQGPRRK